MGCGFRYLAAEADAAVGCRRDVRTADAVPTRFGDEAIGGSKEAERKDEPLRSRSPCFCCGVENGLGRLFPDTLTSTAEEEEEEGPFFV